MRPWKCVPPETKVNAGATPWLGACVCHMAAETCSSAWLSCEKTGHSHLCLCPFLLCYLFHTCRGVQVAAKSEGPEPQSLVAQKSFISPGAGGRLW